MNFDPQWGVGLAVDTDGVAESAARKDGSRQESAAAVMTPTGFYVRYGKRGLDLAIATGFLSLAAIWVFPLIALAIRLESPGPIFFRQKRVGQAGRLFNCLKFRTMAHNPTAPFQQATPNDPRVTRVGRFLRKHNLDELPQFINVLKGEMSVVGPRPHVPALDAVYEARVRGYRYRNLALPGVTGLAQINGHRGETQTLRQMENRVRLDLFYVRRVSLLLDVQTILRTVARSIEGDDKAY